MEIVGTQAGDVLVGTADDDTITGGPGSDWLQGADGNDSLAGEGGRDALWGGMGRDTLSGGGDADMLNGNAGDDLLLGGLGLGDAALYGMATAAVVVDLAAGTATGGDGNDTLSGVEYVVGSVFADHLSGDAANNRLTGREGSDTLAGADGSDVLLGGEGADSLVGGAGPDVLAGDGGDDTIDGGAGKDQASYESAREGVFVDLAAGTAADGWGGNDLLIGIENVRGGRFDDSLVGSAEDNVMNPNLGNDTVVGGAGVDCVSYLGVQAAVAIDLGKGLAKGAGMDVLISIELAEGSFLDDSIVGSSADETMWGSLGADTLEGGLGNDSLDGGANIAALGIDWASYAHAGGRVVVDLAEGTATGEGSDSLVGIEGVIGSAHADVLRGDAGDNAFQGNAGNDTITGGAGALDWVEYAAATGAVTVNLVAGTALGADGADLFTGIEAAAGGAFADLLGGDAGDNRLRGNGGDDTLVGGAGHDGADYRHAAGAVVVRLDLGIATGADGNDVLTSVENAHGSPYADALHGDAGTNVLEGLGGNDTIVGGQGTDIAVFNGGFRQYKVAVEPGSQDLIVIGPEGTDRLQDVEVLQFSDRTFTARQGAAMADRLDGNDASDLLRGREGDDEVLGAGGDDAVYGDEGADTLAGGTGDDFLDGGTGADVMSGGAGSDTYLVDSTQDLVVEEAAEAVAEGEGAPQQLDLGAAIDSVVASIDYTLGSLIENLTLASGGGDLDGGGNELGNVIEGNEGDNALTGGAGDDTLTGGEGIDTAVYAGARADYLLVQGEEGGFSLQGPAADGTDVIDVERLRFADRSLALDLDGNAGTVALFLGAVFGVESVANAGYAGIGLGYADAGMTQDALMQLALDARLGDAASDHGAVVDLLYTNVVGNAPDAPTRAYYVGLLEDGTYTPASISVFAAFTTHNHDHIGFAGLQETGLAYV